MINTNVLILFNEKGGRKRYCKGNLGIIQLSVISLSFNDAIWTPKNPYHKGYHENIYIYVYI